MKRILAMLVILILMAGCSTWVTFKEAEDGEYKVATNKGEIAATLEKDGVKASIDTKKKSIFQAMLEMLLYQGSQK